VHTQVLLQRAKDANEPQRAIRLVLDSMMRTEDEMNKNVG
jgi:hypothetical protein